MYITLFLELLLRMKTWRNASIGLLRIFGMNCSFSKSTFLFSLTSFFRVRYQSSSGSNNVFIPLLHMQVTFFICQTQIYLIDINALFEWTRLKYVSFGILWSSSQWINFYTFEIRITWFSSYSFYSHSLNV
jgi:hypothetical protein